MATVRTVIRDRIKKEVVATVTDDGTLHVESDNAALVENAKRINKGNTPTERLQNLLRNSVYLIADPWKPVRAKPARMIKRPR